MSDEQKKVPTIEPLPNGPYRVTHLARLEGLYGAAAHDTPEMVKLCRCGGSKNKPFCDGSHRTNGFSDAKSPDRVPDRRDDYVAEGITIHDNRGICAHAGKCTDGLAAVFRLREEPWIHAGAASPADVAAVIDTCPSGALSYTIDGIEHRDGAGDPVVGYVPNGPYVVRGGAAALAGVAQGAGASSRRYALCRCGRSTNKPFCSGAHWTHEFDEHAPKRG
ncbi:MAG: CDGSH iron-sulfur domain-containing protein [Vicinamibacterales bacterium]